MTSVIITNLEATLITLLLPEWHADVMSVFQVRRIRADAAMASRERQLPDSARAESGS
jgi:hypothetical protein